VTELFQNIIPQIKDLAKNILAAVPKCEGILTGFECLEKNAEEEHKAVAQEVDKFFADCQAALEEKHKGVLAELNKVYGEFSGTVDERKKALKTLQAKCDGFVNRVADEASIPQNDLERYALFRTLTELKDVLDIVSNTKPPDEKSKICRVAYKTQLTDKSFNPAGVRKVFRWCSGISQVFDIDCEALRGSRSFTTAINAVEETSHDGGAFYDPKRSIIVAVSGNGNNCRDVMITHVTDATHGETTRHSNLIPYGSHGQYPIFDGVQYAYFLQSENEDNDRFGRLDLDELTFEELARFPDVFKEFCSGCCAGGKIYAIDSDDHLCEYDPAANTWTTTTLNISSDCRLLADPLDEGHFYALEVHELFEIEIGTFTKTSISRSPEELDLNQNGEALIVALPSMSRVLFTFLGEWYCYLFEQNAWIQLSNWEHVENGSGSLVIVPFGPSALYHIDDHTSWTGVRLRA